MGRIQSSVGLVSGINIEDTVNQLIALNAVPKQRLESRNANLQKEQVAVAELTTLVVGVQFTTDRLGQASLFSTTSVASNNTAALTARSTGSPKPGAYTFIPVRLAQNQQLSSPLFASSAQKLSAGEIKVHTGGFLDQSASLDELNAGQGVTRGLIKITDRSGASEAIDLRFAQTAQDVVDRINASDKLRVVAGIDGDHFTLTDLSGSTDNNLQITEVAGGTTAADLGLGGISTATNTATGSSVYSLDSATGLGRLRDGRGLDIPASGTALEFKLQDGSTVSLSTTLKSNTANLGQLIKEINVKGDGKLEARISSSGKSIEIEDLTTGSQTFSISSPKGDLAAQLGLDSASSGGVVTSDRLIAGLSDVLLSSLNGGLGLGELGQITITDRSGADATIDLSSATSLKDVIQTINSANIGVSAQLNRAKTGIELTDTTGETGQKLIIANADASNSATLLQLEGEFSASSADSGSLNRQFVTRNTKLKDYNQGKGISLGTVSFTDSAGREASLNLRSKSPETLGDVIDAINDLDVGIEARINEAGDGLLLIDKAGGTGSLKVEDTGSSLAAQQLRIAGTGTALTVNDSAVVGIDGSTTIKIATTADTTVADLIEKINGLTNGPVSASLLNLSSSGGVRLLLNGAASGGLGRVTIEGDVGISFTETSAAQDALIAFGASDNSGGILASSTTNTFAGLVADLEFTVTGTSDKPVAVTVSKTTENLTKQIDTFVEQFNKLRSKLDELTKFDPASQTVGLLFGKTSSLRLETAFGSFLTGTISGAGSIRSLSQLGIRLNETGKLQVDKAKFSEVYIKDPTAVEDFFTTKSTGFSAKAKALADSLAAVDGGALLTKSTTLATQIEQNSRRILTMDKRLASQRTRLLNQFYNMESAISKLQGNLSTINNLNIIPPIGSSSS